MLRKLTDLELSEISGGEEHICNSCKMEFNFGQKVICMYPEYKVYDISAEKFTGNCKGNESLVCNKMSCIHAFRTKRRAFQLGSKVYIPTKKLKMEIARFGYEV